MLYRKVTAAFIAVLMISIIGFFLSLSSVKVSMLCLIIIFIAVIGIRICLSKMDEFKSLYVNTVPMIDPEKDFREDSTLNHEELLNQDINQEVESFMDTFVCEEDRVEVMTEALEAGLSELTQELLSASLEEVVSHEAISVETFELDQAKEIAPESVTESTRLMEEGEESLETTHSFETSSEGVVEAPVEMVESIIPLEMEEQSVESLSLEDSVMQAILHILQKYQKDTTLVTSKMVGNYFTIYVGKRILCRLKLTGRKQYLLTQLTEDEVVALGLSYEAPSKSEAYQSRISFTGVSILTPLEQYLVQVYEGCLS